MAVLSERVSFRLDPRQRGLLDALQREYGVATVSQTLDRLLNDAAAAYNLPEPESSLAEPATPLAKEATVARTYRMPTWTAEAIGFLRQRWSVRSDAAVIAKALATCADAEEAKG